MMRTDKRKKIFTEEQRYLQKNKDTYRKTILQKNKAIHRRTKILTEEQRYLQNNNDTYRRTMIQKNNDT
jgi:hypothetical protein